MGVVGVGAGEGFDAGGLYVVVEVATVVATVVEGMPYPEIGC